jgi:tetratricopeptide (TPR) repeat protein
MVQITLRPQPLGIFPLPASYLVLPEAPDAEAALASLMRGHIPTELPPTWQFYALALADKRDEALIALAGNSSPLARYNRFALSGSPSDYAARASIPPGDLALVFDTTAYVLGYHESPPDPAESDGELRALIMMAWGSAAMQRGDLQAAEADVGLAIALARTSSPLLTAQLSISLAEMRTQQYGPDPIAFQHLREAFDLLKGSGLSKIYAQVALNLGTRYQQLASIQRTTLVEAISCYQEALQIFTRDTYPDLYADAQHSLARSYMAMPIGDAGDQIYLQAAAESLRAALGVYNRSEHPDQWANVCLSLARLLPYLPTTDQTRHLGEAVAIYDDLLASRCPQIDPIGYARLLADQGHVLTRLGDVERAMPKLDHARQLFSAAGDAATAAALAEAGNARAINAPAPGEEWPFEVP